MVKPVIADESAHGGENLEVMREARNYNAFLRSLIRRFAGEAEDAIDFGAGLGTFSDAPAIERSKITCVETEPSAVAILRQNGFRTVSSLESIPTATASYLFSLNVLEHIENDAAVVDEMFRILKPGGSVFIYVPAFMLLFTSMDRHVGHVRRYRRKALGSMFATAGFDVTATRYADFLGFFATLLYRMLDDGQPKPLGSRSVRLYDRVAFPVSRICDLMFSSLLGKNVLLTANKPSVSRTA